MAINVIELLIIINFHTLPTFEISSLNINIKPCRLIELRIISL